MSAVDLTDVDLTLHGGVDVDASIGGALNLGLNDVRGTLMGNVGVGLDSIHATLAGGLGVGLDNINATASANVTGNVGVGLDNINATASANITGNVGVGLDNIRVTQLPPIETRSEVDLGLDDIRIRELPPIKLEFSFRAFRLHLPLNYTVAFSLFGKSIFKLSACGEGMAIGEDYVPRKREQCR